MEEHLSIERILNHFTEVKNFYSKMAKYYDSINTPEAIQKSLISRAKVEMIAEILYAISIMIEEKKHDIH